MIKFIAIRYFDYHMECKETFEDKDKCKKFVDEENEKLKDRPYTWWEMKEEEQE